MTARRIALALAALGLLALLLLPPVFGRLAQQAVEARVASLDANDALDAKLDAYERGWFRSRARVTIGPDGARAGRDSATPLAPKPVHVVVDLEHGPVSLEHGFFFGFVQIEARPAAEAGAPPAYPFHFEARTGLGGALRFAADLPALDRRTPTTRLSFSGSRVVGSLDRGNLAAHGHAATLEIEQAEGRVALRNVELTANGTMTHDGTTIDKAELEAEKAAFAAADGARILDATGLVVNGAGNVDAKRRLDGTLEVTADGMRTGKDARIADALLHGRIRGLDLDALHAYSEAAQRVAAGAVAPDAAVDALEPSLHALLAAGPSITIERLSFDLDGEPLEAHAQASIDPAALPRQGAIDLLAADFWSRVLAARADVTAAKALVRRATATVLERRLRASGSPREAQIAPIAKAQADVLVSVLALRGYLENVGNRYKATLRLENGRLTVNGKRVTLPGG